MLKIVSRLSLYFSALVLLACNTSEKTSNEKSKTTDTSAVAVSQKEVKNILIFGNSLTAGYGLEPAQAYPYVLQNRIDSL